FPKIGQADAANIELAQSRLADGETSDSQVVHAVRAAVQKPRALQICQETVDRTHRQAGAAGHVFRGEAIGRFAEHLQKAQSALQGGDVVRAFWSISHEAQNRKRSITE